MRSSRIGNKGFALVLTLLLTALMVAVVVELVHQAYVDVSLSRGFRDGQQASLLAESGVTGGMKLLQTSLQAQAYSSLADPWAAPIKLDEEVGTVEVRIVEESGKINLNGLAQINGSFEPFTLAALRRLGSRLKTPVPEDAWNSLADWLDSNDETRSGGAESAYYATLRPPYAARNGRLASVYELTLVRGFTPEMVKELAAYVTVYSGTASPVSQINVNVAPKEVLSALDERIDGRMADRIDEERRLKPFKDTAELSRVPGLDTIAIGLIGRISVKGAVFRISSRSGVAESSRQVDAVVRQSGSAQDFLAWQEY